MFNFEGNFKYGLNNLISLDLANSIGIPMKYRYYFNEFSFSNKFRFSVNGGFLMLFQSKVNEINQLGEVDNGPYTQ